MFDYVMKFLVKVRDVLIKVCTKIKCKCRCSCIDKSIKIIEKTDDELKDIRHFIKNTLHMLNGLLAVQGNMNEEAKEKIDQTVDLVDKKLTPDHLVLKNEK